MFLLNHQFFNWSPESSLKATCSSPTLEPLGNLQGTILGRSVPHVGLGLFMSYLSNIFLSLSLIFIVIKSYNLIKTDALAFSGFLRISPIVYG